MDHLDLFMQLAGSGISSGIGNSSQQYDNAMRQFSQAKHNYNIYDVLGKKLSFVERLKIEIKSWHGNILDR
jgi:hypothetical protein